ncbi:HEPN domain-containing protein [Ectopseudomonas toyotomiensis]|uniref:ApeA N-terminal domain 1-containing protein n=1 Tax=Ectopseudomonas toyotomiensis TaxID=554344 RepID=UPI003D0BE6F6
MEEAIIKEDGIFWWNDEEIPKGHFAPESAISGTLEISAEGKATLDLHGMLSPGHPLENIFGNKEERTNPSIQGILKSSGKHALLIKPYNNGGKFRTNGISHETFASPITLLSNKKFPKGMNSKGFYGFEVSLTNLEDWVNRESIKIERTKKTLKLHYTLPKGNSYKIKEGSLKITYDLRGPWHSSTANKTELTETSCINISSRKSQNLDWVTENFNRLEELFTVLIGTSTYLDWPTAKFSTKKESYTCYFHRNKTPQKPVKFTDIAVPLHIISKDFGAIFENWRSSRESFGPGFYLLIGVMKSEKTYVENRFVNYIWGLESLHRNSATQEKQNEKLKEKVKRIIDSAAPKDKRWLENALRNSAEPSLKERLINIFSELPITFKTESLNNFCKECADRRNDISHFGGTRNRNDYQDFTMELVRKSAALQHLYHAVVLKRIGIREDIIQWWIIDGFKSYSIKESLSAAGLKLELPSDTE